MSTTLREALARRADQAGSPELDVESLIDLGERRLHRRQLGAVVGSAAAVLIVIALVIGGAGLVGPSKSTGPIDEPSPSPTPSGSATRPIVYGDGFHNTRVHYGNGFIKTGETQVHMTVTDDGLVYTRSTGQSWRSSEVWFSDGTGVERIGAHVCVGHLSDSIVDAGTSGSLVAWPDCTDRRREAFVLYDTSTDASGERRGVVARIHLVGDYDGPGWHESFDFRDIVGDHVYWTRTAHMRHRNGPGTGPGWSTTLVRYDIATGRRSAVTEAQYDFDRRRTSRGLVVGDTWASGRAGAGIGQGFRVSGGRLIPQSSPSDGSDPVDTSAFVTGSGRPLHLHFAHGYVQRAGDSSNRHAFTLFEWLDDDTVVLGGGVNAWEELKGHNGEIVRCQVSTGRCELVVRQAADIRIVPNLGLPG